MIFKSITYSICIKSTLTLAVALSCVTSPIIADGDDEELLKQLNIPRLSEVRMTTRRLDAHSRCEQISKELRTMLASRAEATLSQTDLFSRVIKVLSDKALYPYGNPQLLLNDLETCLAASSGTAISGQVDKQPVVTVSTDSDLAFWKEKLAAQEESAQRSLSAKQLENDELKRQLVDLKVVLAHSRARYATMSQLYEQAAARELRTLDLLQQAKFGLAERDQIIASLQNSVAVQQSNADDEDDVEVDDDEGDDDDDDDDGDGDGDEDDHAYGRYRKVEGLTDPIKIAKKLRKRLEPKKMKTEEDFKRRCYKYYLVFGQRRPISKDEIREIAKRPLKYDSLSIPQDREFFDRIVKIGESLLERRHDKHIYQAGKDILNCFMR